MKKLFCVLSLLLLAALPAQATTVTVSAYSLQNLPFNPTNIGGSRSITVTATNGSATVTSSAAFPANIVGIGGFQVAIGGTQYVVSSVTSTSSLTLTTNFSGSTGSATMTLYPYVLLRMYATMGFQDNVTGQNIQPGTPGSGNFYKQVAVSIINSGSGNVAYIPAFTIPSTTDAVINNQARYVFGFYRTDGSFLAFYMCGSVSQLAIQPTTPTTWTAICNYNAPGAIVPPNTEAYTKPQIDSRFPNCSQDQLYYFAANGNVLSCLTLGTNLSITSGTLNAAGGGGGGSINAGTTGQIAYYAANGTTLSAMTVGSQLTVSGSTIKTSGVRPAINAVVDYGAVCDGSTNTLVALQNAVDAAALSGGGDVVLPAANCRIAGTLSVPGGVTLVGQGPLKSIISSVTNAIIVDAVEGSGSYQFFGPKIRDLQILGAVGAGSSQIGLKMDDASYYFGSEVSNVHIVDAGSNALYIGNVYSSVWRNLYLDNSADYPLEYYSNAMPANIFESIYVGNLRASAPTAFRIRRGEFTCIGCNGVNNVVASSRWAAVGTKTGVDGDAGNFGAVFDCYNCNIESWVGYGIYVYASSVINLRGATTFAMDATGAATGIPIYYENNGDTSDYFSQFIRRGLIEDTVTFANTVSDYANSQPVHAVGFPAIETIGYGPSISGSEALSLYRNTSTAANVPLSRKDGKSDTVTVTTSTTYAQPGPRYIQANCAAACTITLPWPGYYKVGEMLIVKDISGGAATNNVTVSAGGGGTVNGSSYTIAQNGGGVILMPNDTATDWRVIGDSAAAQPLTSTYVGFGSASNLLTGTANLTYDTGSKILTLTAAGGNPYIAVNDSTNSITTRFGPLAGAPDRAIIGTTSNHPFVLYQNGAAGVGVDTSKHFLPYNASNAQDLGSASALWRTLYAQTSVRVGLGSSTTGALVFLNSANANTWTLQAGTTGSNLTFTLPTADGSSGHCLKTNGSGTLSFASCTSGGTSLTATYVGYGDGSNLLTGTSTFTFNNTTKTLSIINGSGSANIVLNGSSDTSKITYGAGQVPGTQGGIVFPFVGGTHNSGPGIWWGDASNHSGLRLTNGLVWQGENSTHDPFKIAEGTGTTTDGTVRYTFAPSSSLFTQTLSTGVTTATHDGMVSTLLSSGGAGGTNFGLGWLFQLENSGNSLANAVRLSVNWTTATASSETARFVVATNTAGGGLGDSFTVQGDQYYGVYYDQGNVSGAVTWDFNNGNFIKVTATGNITADTFNNHKAGGRYVIMVVQDGTGGKTWTPGTEFKYPGGVSGNILTATANAVDVFLCDSDGTNLWCNGLFDVKNP